MIPRHVLILVLVEVVLWDTVDDLTENDLMVLILVLVEVVLWAKEEQKELDEA